MQRVAKSFALLPSSSSACLLSILVSANGSSRRSMAFSRTSTRLDDAATPTTAAPAESVADATTKPAVESASTATAAAVQSAAEQVAKFEREAAIRAAEDASKKNALMLERAAALRREIHEIWAHPEDTWEEQQALVEAVKKAKKEEAAAAKAKKDKQISENTGNVDASVAEETAVADSNISSDESEPVFGKFPNVGSGLSRYEKQAALARAFLDKHADIFSPTVARDEDVTRALGEAFDRLLLMQVPLPENGASTEHLQRVLDIAGKNGRELSVKVVQHLFSRCSSYPEAIALLYAMRYANINMSVDCYYAMIFSLQRLDEEAWCLRYREEALRNKEKLKKSGGGEETSSSSSSSLSSSSDISKKFAPKAGPDVGVRGEFPLSAKALDFIVFGTDNQLLPESKPWVGRGIFTAEDEHAGSAVSTAKARGNAAGRRNTTRDFDAMGARWIRRLKDGQETLRRSSNDQQADGEAVKTAV